jgi:hypothetical protein
VCGWDKRRGGQVSDFGQQARARPLGDVLADGFHGHVGLPERIGRHTNYTISRRAQGGGKSYLFGKPSLGP